jgi:hypothetical protein
MYNGGSICADSTDIVVQHELKVPGPFQYSPHGHQELFVKYDKMLERQAITPSYSQIAHMAL